MVDNGPNVFEQERARWQYPKLRLIAGCGWLTDYPPGNILPEKWDKDFRRGTSMCINTYYGKSHLSP